MPIEIKELVIKAQVGESGNSNAGSENNASSVGDQNIIAECVDKVLEILKEKSER